MSAVGRFGAIAALVLALLSACVRVKSEGRELGLLPEGFEESDLVGTWQALYDGDARTTDTIILREDGTYQQIYHRYTDNYRLETPWQRWYVETRPSGKLYVHLEGMHYCILTEDVCALERGGVAEDFCGILARAGISRWKRKWSYWYQEWKICVTLGARR
jgi:hypothetical protein